MTERPRTQYSEHCDGLGDPQRLTVEQRARTSEERVTEQQERRMSLSPMLRRLQAATSLALGGR